MDAGVMREAILTGSCRQSIPMVKDIRCMWIVIAKSRVNSQRNFKKGWEKEQLLEHIREADTKELTERLSYCYPKMEEVSLKTKISVSELKHRDMVFEPEEEQTVRWFEEEVPLPYVPEFVKAREENQGAKKRYGSTPCHGVH